MVSEFRNHKTSEEDCWERLYILANEYLIFSILINCIWQFHAKYTIITGILYCIWQFHAKYIVITRILFLFIIIIILLFPTRPLPQNSS